MPGPNDAATFQVLTQNMFGRKHVLRCPNDRALVAVVVQPELEKSHGEEIMLKYSHTSNRSTERTPMMQPYRHFIVFDAV